MTIARVQLPAVAQYYVVTFWQILQQLLQKFVAEHQKELAGFLADLQQTEIDVRQFHSFGDLDRTEAYAPAHSRAVFL